MASMRKAILAFALALTSASLAYGAPALNPWPSFSEPAPGPARSIGEYSSGCLQGAQALPLDGVGYQVMRPSRRRNYGHPALIDYLRKLGHAVDRARLGVLLIGDLSHVRGGRAASGHASHQTGLDVDVWYLHPKRARRTPLSMLAREELTAESVVDLKRQTILPRWRAHVGKVLRLAAQDERVDRVFVHPAIKRTLCEQPAERRTWLRKIRPWYGHADHFHARLGCMAGDSDCRAQAALPPGDGCDKLTSWLRVRPRAKLVRKAPAGTPRAQPSKVLAAYRAAVKEGRGWPERCNALLESPALAAR
jgi:penicillin-insensitive murein DD-endopeptidase